HAVDELRDLAVLVCAQPFAVSVAGLVASESVPETTSLQVTGVSGNGTGGAWLGSAVRDSQVPCGVFEADLLETGMTGAPVRRTSDDQVVGVVSAAQYSDPATDRRL